MISIHEPAGLTPAPGIDQPSGLILPECRFLIAYGCDSGADNVFQPSLQILHTVFNPLQALVAVLADFLAMRTLFRALRRLIGGLFFSARSDRL